LLLDLAEEHPQRLAVGGVAGQDLVSQRQAVGRDHQRDHHLRAVRPLVAAVAVTAFSAFRQVRCVDLEVGAGQIVQQHVEVGVEQIAPAPDQMREQRFLMRQQEIVAGIELVLFRKSEVRTQEIGHCAVAEPLAMQSPLAARRDQPIGRQHLQDLIPPRSLPARRQPIDPEPIELKLLPQLPGQPAGAPLPRSTKLHLGHAKLHHRRVAGDHLASIFRKQRQRPHTAGVLVEHLDRLAPRRRLRGVDLAEIQHMSLHHSAAVETLVLDHVPVVVRLAVLLSLGASQKHDAANLSAPCRAWESGRSSLQPFLTEIEDLTL
jgi:hypothetical protein